MRARPRRGLLSGMRADTTVARSPFERGFGGLLSLAMVGLLVAVGPRELLYAVTHPAEDLSFAFALPVAVFAYGLWVALTPRRRGWPVLLVVAGVVSALLGLATLYLVALGRGFKN